MCIEWVKYMATYEGRVDRPIEDKVQYVIIKQFDGGIVVDTDMNGGKWGNVDIPFDTIEEAKQWCEMHWLCVGWQGGKRD